jgi:putative Mg2+ transporter-C (MgtC) family protein
VTGIGFLGAGAIIRQGLSVRGLTTAATLWLVAAIGLSSGAGYYSAAVITTLVALISLWPLRIAAHLVITRFRPESGRLLVQLPIGESPGPLITSVEELGAKLHTLEISQEGDRRNVLLDVELPKGAEATEVVAKLGDVEQVLGARWTD